MTVGHAPEIESENENVEMTVCNDHAENGCRLQEREGIKHKPRRCEQTPRNAGTMCM
jgi:hypothetical protein